MPADERDPLDRLLDAAGRAVQPAHPGWADLPRRLGRLPHAARRRRRWWLLAPLPVGAAAAVLVMLLSNFPGVGPQATAGEGPVRVERQDVDVTVLSVAETDGETLYMPLLQRLGQQFLPNPGMMEEANRQLDQDRLRREGAYGTHPVPAAQRTGQALVKDHRLIFNLREGDNVVHFTDVAATIDPTSVRLTSDQPGTAVKEQSFEYDLATADSLLKRYVDREIVCIGKDGHEVAGYLASYDEASIVLASGPPSRKARGTQTLDRRQLQAVRLKDVPPDLLVKPTLVWKLHADRPGRHDTTLTYLCGHMKWQADYVIVVIPGDDRVPDLLDVTGWVSLENASGTTYTNAGLKLIAGDVNRVRDPWAPVPPAEPNSEADMTMFFGLGMLGDRTKTRELVEKSFFEYHLYTLTAPSTVRDREIKQLKLLRREGVKADRLYVYDPQIDARRIGIELEARNDKDNHLGLPLPKGRVTFEQRDADGETAFTGQTEIDHTAVRETLKLRHGFAFDVAGETTQLSYEQLGPRHYRTQHRMLVRNHKGVEIPVRGVVHLGPTQHITKASMAFDVQDVNTADFNFRLKANGEQEILYTVDTQY
jgi:hypothetical protein